MLGFFISVKFDTQIRHAVMHLADYRPTLTDFLAVVPVAQLALPLAVLAAGYRFHGRGSEDAHHVGSVDRLAVEVDEARAVRLFQACLQSFYALGFKP